jgi:hypothetical protein
VATIPLPDEPPPTMPESAREGGPPPPPPGYAGKHRAGGERAAGGIPPGTGPDVPAPEGTSEDKPADEDIHTPDVGPGGDDFDTASPPLTSRPDTARQPSPPEPPD